MSSKVRSPKSEIRKRKKILIVRTDKIGDLVLSTPVIKAVRDAYPDSHIAMMVRPYAHEIIKGNPYLDEIITYSKAKKGLGVLSDLKFIMYLRKKKFDLALILHPKNRTHIIAFLSGIPERIGYNKKLGALLTKKIPHLKQYGLKHEIDYTLDILEYAGIDCNDRKLYIAVNESSEKNVDKIFAENGISKDDTVVTVHPGSSCPSKRWAVAHFARVADALVREAKAKIVIIAGPRDKKFGDDVAALMNERALNLSCKTTVSDIVSILRRSKLFISNDSGPVHISCAVGTPVISIFGRSDRGLSPKRWRPVGARDVALHKDVGCVICESHKCKLGFKCLEAISEDEVLAAARAILGK
jgi:lipopolysaccharide heptosyltransferase II